MIREIKERVEKILNDYPSARNSDSHLLAIIWREDVSDMGDIRDFSCHGFLNLLSEGKLTYFESVRRTRQKIQEVNEKLRGDNYRKRIDELEPEVKKEVKELSFHEKFGWKEPVIKEGDLFCE